MERHESVGSARIPTAEPVLLEWTAENVASHKVGVGTLGIRNCAHTDPVAPGSVSSSSYKATANMGCL